MNVINFLDHTTEFVTDSKWLLYKSRPTIWWLLFFYYCIKKAGALEVCTNYVFIESTTLRLFTTAAEKDWLRY